MNCLNYMKSKYKKRILLTIAFIYLLGFLTGWVAIFLTYEKNFPQKVQETDNVSRETIRLTEPFLEETHVIALTLAGECFDDQPQDKINVAWVICNRLQDGRFGETIQEVVTSPNQFLGYWNQGRTISDNDWQIAEEVLTAYYAGEEPIHNYLYFTGGTGVINKFK